MQRTRLPRDLRRYAILRSQFLIVRDQATELGWPGRHCHESSISVICMVIDANIAAAQSHFSKTAVPGDSLGFPNVVVLKDLNLADREIQIQILEVSLRSIAFKMC